MGIERPFYPIVYVRGFAATQGEIEDTSADPFMGFNLGATKIRQNFEGHILRFIFESPLLRLMKDEGYQDCFRDGDFLPAAECADPRSIWIFRYYERASDSLGDGTRQAIPDIAQDLRRFILRIRDSTCQKDAAKEKDFRVHLVAHSMGGLICRCYLQNICVYGTGNKIVDATLELPTRAPFTPSDSIHLVDKVFTYATPHNGIDLAGFSAPNLGILDPFHVRNFNRVVIRDYLRLPAQSDGDDSVRSLNGAFPPDRFFCLIGSNYRDYDAFHKLSRRATGEMSDGLVMIKNAAVDGAPRAIVHRSHSGHFGIVNSEEGYQNLRRFLFGDIRVEATLFADEILLPTTLGERKAEADRTGKDFKLRASYQIEVTARVRGATYYMHERKVDHASAILAPYDDFVKRKKPEYLFSGYLLKRAKTDTNDTALAFAVRVSIRVPMYEINERFWLDEHFEGGFVFDETVTFFVRPRANKTTIKFGLASKIGIGEVETEAEAKQISDKLLRIEINLGFLPEEKNPPRPGFRGKLRLDCAPWNRPT
ncbi:MAG: hypothetical protein KF691_03430 [Phycisphaeraceae bacterium]|nr:hypothetical protein [Phycisphaeraceae bacterium]